MLGFLRSWYEPRSQKKSATNNNNNRGADEQNNMGQQPCGESRKAPAAATEVKWTSQAGESAAATRRRKVDNDNRAERLKYFAGRLAMGGMTRYSFKDNINKLFSSEERKVRRTHLKDFQAWLEHNHKNDKNDTIELVKELLNEDTNSEQLNREDLERRGGPPPKEGGVERRAEEGAKLTTKQEKGYNFEDLTARHEWSKHAPSHRVDWHSHM